MSQLADHVVTLGDVFGFLGELAGLALLLAGIWLLASVIAAKLGKTNVDTSLTTGCGCILAVIGMVLIGLVLSA